MNDSLSEIGLTPEVADSPPVPVFLVDTVAKGEVNLTQVLYETTDGKQELLFLPKSFASENPGKIIEGAAYYIPLDPRREALTLRLAKQRRQEQLRKTGDKKTSEDAIYVKITKAREIKRGSGDANVFSKQQINDLLDRYETERPSR